ncbi:hypothetical protein V8J36_18460 [Frigidibacter sp. MR17.14]|uniref:ArnT family glycosyltransferase n=1 Tax=Frigidibacter sp. MR17.14 TaxID=3126509 RepID=UPI003012AE91
MRQLTRAASALSILLALAVVAVLLAHYAPQLGKPGMNQYDEYHTLDRTLAAARDGHWSSVYANHGPSFRKPPLQYWLGALLVRAGLEPLLAMRTVAMGFGLGLLALTGVLAARLSPRNGPTAAATAVLLLAASPMLWSQATAAMLDAGAALFTLVTILGLVLALREPRLIWIAVAGVWLGALQKAPVGIAAMAAAAIALRYWRVEPGLPLAAPEAKPLRRRAFRVAVLLILAWPVFQALQHGYGAFKTSLLTEMAERFVPTIDDDTAGNWTSWINWMIDDSALLWPAALAATLSLPLWRRRGESVVVSAWALIFILGMTFADGDTYSRYLLVLLPVLAAGLATALVAALRLPLLPAVLAAAAVFTTGAARMDVNTPDPDDAARDALIRGLAARVRPEDTLIFCRYYGGSTTMNASAVSAWASAGQPVVSITDADSLERARANGLIGAPLIGFCSAEALAELAPHFDGLEIVGTSGDWRAFTATDLH